MSDVIHSVDGSIWQVEIDRTERANALRRRTIRQIEAVLDAAEAPESDAARGQAPTREACCSPAASNASAPERICPS